jgi:hypothetical protein
MHVVEMQKQKKQSFNHLLLDSIDESLAALGENIKTSVYFHLDESYHIKKEKIPNNIEKFSDALEKIFGVGARYLEILFMKELYLKIKEKNSVFEAEFSVPDIRFADYIHILRSKYDLVLEEIS